MKGLLSFIFLFSSIGYAKCPDVTYLKQGQPAPCVGYLFSPEKEKELRGLDSKYETLQQIVLKKDEKINSLSYSLDQSQQSNVSLQRQLKAEKAGSTLEKAIYLTLGLLAGYGIGGALNK